MIKHGELESSGNESQMQRVGVAVVCLACIAWGTAILYGLCLVAGCQRLFQKG